MISYTSRLDNDVFLLVFHHRLTVKIHAAIDFFLFIEGGEGSVICAFDHVKVLLISPRNWIVFQLAKISFLIATCSLSVLTVCRIGSGQNVEKANEHVEIGKDILASWKIIQVDIERYTLILLGAGLP
jgi:hypothetical protein